MRSLSSIRWNKTSLPSATAGPLKPSPTFICQSTGGPSFGHDGVRSLVGYAPLRDGPRNCGQSLASVVEATRTARHNTGSLRLLRAPFLLTAALSLGEMEKRELLLNESERAGFSGAESAALPEFVN